MRLIKKHKWKGFVRLDCTYGDNEVIVILPDATPSGKWIWRAEFFNDFASADIAMINRGYTLVYYKISDLYGAPCAVELMYNFHLQIVKFLTLEKKAILFGFSRGGLYAFNYSCEYPELVAGLYLDAPVLDIRSWPGGLMGGIGSEKEWDRCYKLYEYKDSDDAMNYNFVDRIDVLIKAKIPIILVVGDSDKIVPYEENGEILANLYEKECGNIKVIIKKGVGHHPHSLIDPTPIVDFLVQI